jgi:hypothetical protein
MIDLIDKYDIIRREIQTQRPSIWNDVVILCAAVPSTIDKCTFWLNARDKPCWSNITVAIGERLKAQLELSRSFDSYDSIASPAWDILFTGAGRSWKKNTSFSLRGDAVKQFVASLGGKGLANYLWRLYAIRGLAVALSRKPLAGEMIGELATATSSGKIDYDWLQQWVRSFAIHAGRGWGITSIYHVLTDLGVTCKPDIHVTRSLVFIGLLPNACQESVANYEHEAVRAVIELANQVTQAASSRVSRSLREVDKVLMEWSRQGLARPL